MSDSSRFVRKRGRWGSRLGVTLALTTAFTATLSGGLSLSAPAGATGKEEGDDATLRAQALDAWYNDNYDASKGKKGWSQKYRRFVLEAANKERARWARVVRARDGSSALILGGEASVLGSNWLNIGPTRADFIKNGSTVLNKTDAGRIRTIVVDPANTQRIFVATSGGGVWRSLDGGINWTAITESLGSLSTGYLEMDPNNSQVLYLGLGDPFDGTGVGLVKSVDGGTTWSAPVYLGSSTVTTQIMVARSDSNIVLATTNQGLFRSTDAGATWSNVPLATGQTVAPMAWSIAWTGGNGYAISLEANPAATSGTTDGQIWRTTDNGASFTRATGFTKSAGVGRATLASAPSNRQTLYVMAAIPNSTSASDLADIFKSTNGGTSFSALAVTKKRLSNGSRGTLAGIMNGQGWYDQLVLVHPTNANTVYFGGALYMARTTDGGSSFSQVSDWLGQYSLPYVHADFHAGTFDASGTIYIGSDGGVFKSSNSGTSFTDSLNIGMTTHLLYSVGSSTANRDAVIGGLQDNGTRVRSGSTSTFNQYIGGDGFGSDIHPTNANLMLGSLYYSRIYKSADGGATFTQSCSGITECNTSNAPFLTKVVPWTGDSTGNTVLTFANTKAYKSTNYGSSWSALGTSGLPTTNLFLRNIGVARTDQNRVGLVANSGRVFLSQNGGASWTQAPNLPNNGLSLSYIHYDSSNPSILYVASVAPDSTKSHLWKSLDGGASWSAIDGGGFPTGIPVNVIKNDPLTPSTLFAGTHLGVYRSLDGGATWSRFGSGMPLVQVTDFYISSDSTLMRAATFGRGFFELQ